MLFCFTRGERGDGEEGGGSDDEDDEVEDAAPYNGPPPQHGGMDTDNVDDGDPRRAEPWHVKVSKFLRMYAYKR